MQLIAHRGLITKDIKENTIESFKNAIKNGYDGIELDVRLTKDKKIVVIHNNLINKTSNGTGSVNNYNYKDLLKYNFGSKKIPSRIPLLESVLRRIKNKIVVIELKEKIDLKDLEKILDKYNKNDYYISSFNKKYIDNIIDTKYKKGLINYVFNSNIDLKKYDFLMILEDLFNENIYNYLKNNNIEPILYNTLNCINIKNKNIIADIKYII